MGEQVTTREEALALACDWAEGRLSHLNVFMAVENGPENRTRTLTDCAMADAAEVAKWSALANALPPGGSA